MNASGPPPPAVPALRTRRQARERALSLLYEAEVKGESPEAVLSGLPADPDRFAGELVAGVGGHAEEIDGWLRRYARDWAVERMPAIDRALLRIGVYELLHRPDVPTAVVIAEAVELASRFSTEDSGRFVNGVLARIADEVRGPVTPEAPPA
jgi:transcription antitermination protein NusB